MNRGNITHWARAKILRYTGILELATSPRPFCDVLLLLARVICLTLKNSSPSMARSIAVSIRTVAT